MSSNIVPPPFCLGTPQPDTIVEADSGHRVQPQLPVPTTNLRSLLLSAIPTGPTSNVSNPIASYLEWVGKSAEPMRRQEDFHYVRRPAFDDAVLAFADIQFNPLERGGRVDRANNINVESPRQ